MNELVEAVTDAVFTEACMAIYEDAGELDDDTARRVKALLFLYAPRLARAAVDALPLTPEWTRTIGEVYPCGSFATRERAEARNAELDRMYPDRFLHRGVASRLVLPWVVSV